MKVAVRDHDLYARSLYARSQRLREQSVREIERARRARSLALALRRELPGSTRPTR